MKEENQYTNFSMRLTYAQRDIMDFVMDNILIEENYKSSKAAVVIDCFKEWAIGYLIPSSGLPEEYFQSLSDEMLLGLLRKEQIRRIKRPFYMCDLEVLKKLLDDQIEIYKSNPDNKENPEEVFSYIIEVIKEKEAKEDRKGDNELCQNI